MKMKAKLLSLLLVVFVGTAAMAQKTHFDNKSYVEGEMLVRILDDSSIRSLVNRAPSNYQLTVSDHLSKIMDIWKVEFDETVISHEQLQYWLYSQPEVMVADYNYYVQVRSTIPTTDPSFGQQWHHVNNGSGGGTADADIDSDLAWDITTGGTTANGHDIVVCMVEGNGGNLNHQDLSPNRWYNTNEIPNNGIDDDGNGYVDDYEGWNTGSNNDDTGTGSHGTNCLGMIGAKGDNGLNVTGANWDVKLMVVNMQGSLTQANVIEAYEYPLTLRQAWNASGGTTGAFVVATSASWGIDGADPTNYPLWCDYYNTLGQNGILNVGATTNQNLNVDTAGDMPTACSSQYMIGVGRTDKNDNTAGGYGVTTIELGAPGIDVVTTSGTTGITTTTGTSFACPLTAGVIGLAYSIPCNDFMNIVMANPQQGADLVLQALLSGTDAKTQLASKFVTGGRLNSFNTINDLMAVGCSGSLCLAPSGISTGSIADNSASVTFTAYSGGTSTTMYWREVGASTWTTIANATSPVSLTGLSTCTEYEYYLETDCGGGTISSPSSTQTFTTTGCGACIDLPYCANGATDGVDEWIGSFVMDTYTNNSGNDNGFGDYTGVSNIAANIGQSYNFTVTPDWAGTQYDEYTRIWIDFNQNGTLETSELVYDQGTAGQNVVTGSIAIPATALPGSTRLRVQMAYQGAGQNTLPANCGDFTYGETEDYCVDIIDNSGGGVGIDELGQLFVVAYPNPASTSVTIKADNNFTGSVQLVDVVGKVIATGSMANGTANIDLSNAVSGTYFYRLANENGSVVASDKLVITK